MTYNGRPRRHRQRARNIADAATQGAGAFLSRICLPAAEEFGLLIRDKVGAWRARNALGLAKKAELMLESLDDSANRHAHPRIVGAIIENGSWCDEDEVQSMWAGLLATACTPSGTNQENLIYVNLLAQLTASEARIFNLACKAAIKKKSPSGLLLAQEFVQSLEQIMQISGTAEIHTIDLELDHRRTLGILDSGLRLEAGLPAQLTPTAIGLQLHVRCQGYVGSPVEYFGL